MTLHIHIPTSALVVLVLTLLVSTASFGDQLHKERSYWEKLLHFDGTRSRVISEEFFVSTNGQQDPLGEKNETIRLLKSSQGNDVACNFPARYAWLRKQVSDLPNFDLKKCENLQKFLLNFQKENLSIVFVSELVDAPASAFGHILLVFNNHDTPIPLAEAVHFSAKTERDGFFRYVYSGVSGKYAGYYIRDPFFRKLNGYTVHEQRAMYIYRLDFSPDEISRIVLHLYELRKARFHYYFIKENCAFQISELLAIGLPDETRALESASFVLPIDVVKLYADRLTERSSLAPSLLRVDNLLKKLTADELQTVKDVIAQRLVPSDTMPDHVKEVLALHYQHSFRRHKIIYANYDQVQSLQYSPSSFKPFFIDPLENSESDRVLFGVFRSTTRTGVLFGYRPMLRDIYVPQSAVNQETELSLFDVQLLVHSDGFRLEQLDLLKIRSMPNYPLLWQPLSWSFYFGFNRANIRDEMRTELELGLGHNFGNRDVTFDVSASAGLQESHGVDFYLKPNIIFMSYFPASIKLGLQISDKQFHQQHYRQHEIFLSSPLDKGFFNIRYIHAPTGNSKTIVSLNLPI